MTASPPGAIDTHAHYYGGLVEALKQRRERPYVAPDDAGRDTLHAMTASTVLVPGYVDPAARLAWMDAAGIATQIMTFPGALGLDVMPVRDVADAIVAFNDHLAALCRSAAGRFVGLAGLPLADMDVAAAELRRARLSLGLAGAILPGNYFLTEADSERLRPVFAAADACGALLMVHPGLMPGEDPPAPYPDHSVLRASALQLQASIAQMGLTLVMGRLLTDHPNVTVQLVNLGGTLPFILERVEAVADSRGVNFPAETLRRMVYDTASLGPRAIETAVRVLGADHLMLGTDYPIFRPADPASSIRDAAIGAYDKARILHGTAEAVLRRLGLRE